MTTHPFSSSPCCSQPVCLLLFLQEARELPKLRCSLSTAQKSHPQNDPPWRPLSSPSLCCLLLGVLCPLCPLNSSSGSRQGETFSLQSGALLIPSYWSFLTAILGNHCKSAYGILGIRLRTLMRLKSAHAQASCIKQGSIFTGPVHALSLLPVTSS